MTGQTPPTAPQSMQHIYCPECGYNLTGLTQQTCPECGCAFDAGTIVTNPAGPMRTTNSLILLAIGPIVFAVTIILLVSISASPAGPYVIGLLASAALGMILASSLIVGRRIARRLARRAPSDPPTPVTIATTLVFGGLLMGAQIAVSLTASIAGCLMIVA